MAANPVRAEAPSRNGDPATTKTWPKSFLQTLGSRRNNGAGNRIVPAMRNGKKDVEFKIRVAMDANRFSVGIIGDADIMPGEFGNADGFKDRLFGGKTAGIMRIREFILPGMVDLCRSKDVIQKRLSPAFDRRLDAVNFNDVYAGAYNHRKIEYSKLEYSKQCSKFE